MAEESRRPPVGWKAGLAVGAGVVAVAGVAAIAYKLVQARKARRATSPALSDPGVGEPERSAQPAGTTPLNNGGAVPVGVQDGPKSDYDQAMELKQEGNDHYKKQEFEDAVRCYQEALQKCPADKEDDVSKLYHNIAAVFTMLASQAQDTSEKNGHWMSVVDYCSRALDKNKRYVKALSRRLRAYEALGRKRDALYDVTRIVILDETQGKNFAMTITSLLKELGKDDAAKQFDNMSSLAPTNHIIRTYLDSFVWNDDLSEKALKEMWVEHRRKTLASSGAESQKSHDIVKSEDEGGTCADDALPVVMISDIENDDPEGEEVKDDAAAGAEDLERGFDEDPFVEAAAAFRNRQYPGIIEALTKAIEEGSPVFLVHALLLRGTFYVMWRDNEKGLEDLDAVISTEGAPKELVLNALIKKSTVHAGIPEMEKVDECFRRCLQLDENCADALIHRARVKLESPEDSGSMDTVIESLTKAISLVPQSAFALYSLATAYHRLASVLQSPQVLNQAVGTFEKAIKKFPEYGDGLVLYAMCLQDIGNVSDSEKYLTKAAKLEPENPNVHLSLGMVSLLSNDQEKGKAHLQKAIAVDNSCVQAYDTLASIELQAGNSQGALDLYTTASRYARSQTELSQVLVAREVISAQQTVCQEYGLSVKDLMSRVLQQSPMMM